MNIKLLSDIHLEFLDRENFDVGEGEVLVLAGDICCAADISERNEYGLEAQEFFYQCAENYERVFYVMGNHEHYGSDITTSAEKLRAHIDPRITLLDNQSEFHNGVHFIGATMWTNYLGGNKMEMSYAESIMNDFYQITNNGVKLRAHDILEQHNNTMEWFEQVLPTLRGPKVMITHHHPSRLSLEGIHFDECASSAYVSELSEFILKHEPDLWLCGHIHNPVDYRVGKTRVVSNPVGYPEQRGTQYNPDLSLDISLVGV